MNVLMAIGNIDIEDLVSDLPDVQRAESVEDMDLVQEILCLEEYDFLILNSLLSVGKTIETVRFVHDSALLLGKSPKVIVLIRDFTDQKWLAQLVGLGVNAFATFDQLNVIQRLISEYPETFDWSILSATEVDKKGGRAVSHIQSAVVGTISVGVFALQHGAGSTTAACKLAAEIANCGYRVVCLSIEQDHLTLARKHRKHKNVEYIAVSADEKDTVLQVAYGNTDYQVIVIDFGAMFVASNAGQLLSSKQGLIGDFLRCNYKICLCFASDWYTDQLQMFLKNDFFLEDRSKGQLSLIISGEDVEGAIADYHELPIWDREEWESFISRFLQNAGIRPHAKSSKEERKFFPSWIKKGKLF